MQGYGCGGKITNFDLNAPVDITTASLSASASQLQAQSSLIASHVQALSAVRGARLAMYDGPMGLGAKLKATEIFQRQSQEQNRRRSITH